MSTEADQNLYLYCNGHGDDGYAMPYIYSSYSLPDPNSVADDYAIQKRRGIPRFDRIPYVRP